MSKIYFFMGTQPEPTAPLDKREVYWKQNCLEGYHDPSLKNTFGSKREMRAYMARHGLRDAGERVNPDKHVRGNPKAKPHPKRQAIQDYIRAQGGTDGLLQKFGVRR